MGNPDIGVRLSLRFRRTFSSLFGVLVLGLEVACTGGCLVTQDTEPMPPEPIAVNRPPAIDLVNVEPSAPVVELNLSCPQQSASFVIRVIELDTQQALRVMWFLDYDVAGQAQDGPFRQDSLQMSGTARRSASLDPGVVAARFPALGAHTLEAFVIEEDALSPSSSDLPEWRATRDCSAEGFPLDCVSTHPASFRWVIDIRDEQCQ